MGRTTEAGEPRLLDDLDARDAARRITEQVLAEHAARMRHDRRPRSQPPATPATTPPTTASPDGTADDSTASPEPAAAPAEPSREVVPPRASATARSDAIDGPVSAQRSTSAPDVAEPRAPAANQREVGATRPRRSRSVRQPVVLEQRPVSRERPRATGWLLVVLGAVVAVVVLLPLIASSLDGIAIFDL